MRITEGLSLTALIGGDRGGIAVLGVEDHAAALAVFILYIHGELGVGGAEADGVTSCRPFFLVSVTCMVRLKVTGVGVGFPVAAAESKGIHNGLVGLFLVCVGLAVVSPEAAVLDALGTVRRCSGIGELLFLFE